MDPSSLGDKEPDREILTGAGPFAVHNGLWLVDHGRDVLQRNHRITGIPEPFGGIFDAKHAIFKVLAVGWDRAVDVRTHAGGDPKCFPQVAVGRHCAMRPTPAFHICKMNRRKL